jgi:hypothetical protein
MTSNTPTRIKQKLATSFGVMLVLAAALALSAWHGNGEFSRFQRDPAQQSNG